MTTTVEFGRVQVKNFEPTQIPNLRDPKVVDAIWKDAQRATAEEARPGWINALIHWVRSK